MKSKAVAAVIAAAAAMSCVSVCSFAECADTEILLAAVPAENTAEARGVEAESAEGGVTTSGVEGVAAVFGTIVLAGAAVVISRKKA